MTADATTIARFFLRDKRSYENYRHFVQRPVRFELRRYFKAVGLWHDKIDDHEIGLEAAGGFQRPPRIVHCARKVISGVFEKQLRTAREPRIVVALLKSSCIEKRSKWGWPEFINVVGQAQQESLFALSR